MPFGAPKCPKCNKAVYFAERQNVLGKDWHKVCVKCETCNKKLEPGSYSDNEGKIYCKPCYGQVTGMKGYGYGGAGGCLASYTQYGGGESELIGGDPVEPDTRNGSFPSGGSGSTAAVDNPARFCTECGVKAAGGKFCAECGAKYE